jgi:SAM-dependent methyltransferase
MGYGPEYFAGAVSNWIENKWLPLHGRIVEFGAQEFYCDQDEARGATEKFLRARGISDEAIRMALPKGEPVAVSKVYRALGIDYLAIDVDRAFGSQFYDLNTFAPAPNWRGAFDLVNNEGTIEHLINPINGFQVAHELLKVDGVAIHSMPLTGWIDHGLTYPTIKFYAELIGTNRYEMLRGEILISQSPLDFADARFVLRDRDNGRTLEDVGHLKLTNAWIRLTVRKTNDAEFRIPFDHLLVDRPQELGRQLADNHAAYSRTQLTENWLSGLVNDAGPKAVEANAAVGLLERIRSRFRSG